MAEQRPPQARAGSASANRYAGEVSLLAVRGPVRMAILLLAATACTGCSKSPSIHPKPADEASSYGRLPGLKATPDQALQDELARITEEGGVPELLTPAATGDERNVAAGLAGLFLGLDRQTIAAIRAESDKLFPAGPFTLSPVQLERAIRFRQRFDQERIGFRLALERPECRFPIAFEAGPAADLAFLDAAWIGARLEAFRAAEALAAHEVDAAVESLRTMLRMAHCLAAEAHPIVRLEGAFLRTEAFLVLAAIAKNPNLTRRHLETVHGCLTQQLDDWPDDALAWIGDRALGMVLFEAIRDGRLIDFLTPQEIEHLEQEGILSEFKDAAGRNVGQDQLYYLTAMRKIIDICKHPYHARVDDFEALRRDLHARRNDPDFPLVAGRFLLLDIEKGHVIQARDRANCESWVLATALALGAAPPPNQINPLTGQPYRVQREGGTVVVSGVGTGEDGDDPPWMVPDLSQAPSQ